MRKTSQDGGESNSATSRVENEGRKSKGSLLDFKMKKIGKRTAPNLSEESDEAVVEPLLEKKSDGNRQSAKYYAKAKDDTVKEISKLFNDKKITCASNSGFGTTESLLSEKDPVTPKPHPNSNAPLHNHMNTNVFYKNDFQSNGTTKSQIMVEVGVCKESGYNPSPLIFTTAKIHSDEKSKQMEPVQMTPGPIVSTVVEKSQYKYGKLISTTTEQKVGDASTVRYGDSCGVVETDIKLKPLIGGASDYTDLPVTEINTREVNSNVDKNYDKEQKKGENIQNKPVTDKTNNTDTIINRTNTSTAIAKNNSSLAKNNKMLDDKPRILLSDSMIKSNNLVTSVKPSKEPTEVLESTMKQPQLSQLFGNDNPNNETTNTRTDNETKTNQNNTSKEDTKQTLNKNIKSPTLTKEFEIKQQKLIPSGISNKTNVMITKKEKSSDSSKLSSANVSTLSSKNIETLKDSNAKTPMSTKMTTQATNLGKEEDKSLIPSANGSIKMNPKTNNEIISSTSTISTGKPSSSINLPSIESAINKASDKSMCISTASPAKPITLTVTTSTVTLSNATKTTNQSTSTKATTSTPNPKPSSTSTKTTSKPSSVTTKSTQLASTSTTVPAKQSNTHTAKTTSNKPPSLASTKMPKIDISSPSAIPTSGKSVVSKPTPTSTSKPESTSSFGSRTSTSSVQATSNAKSKSLESNKSVSKSMDRPKDPR